MIAWIMRVTTREFLVLVNGDVCGYFEGKKGLHQGGPHVPGFVYTRNGDSGYGA